MMKNENDKLFHSSPLLFTLKAWPVITIATIGLCFLTQFVASLFGIELKEQHNVEVMRRMFLHAFDNWKFFAVSVLNASLVVVILPALEELVFRGPLRWLKKTPTQFTIAALVLGAMFSGAHYFSQPWPDNAFIALFFFGLAQAWLYRKTDRLWCVMLNHSLFNLTNLVLLFFVPAPK